MAFLQKLGKAVMLPVACLPLCALLMGIGYFLCPASMQGGDVTGALPLIGLFLVRAGGALIDRMALLFAVGIGVGLADDKNGSAGLAALISYLMITTLLQADFVCTILPSANENPLIRLSFEKINNPFIGILAGIIGSECYNRFKSSTLPEWLAFFSGRRMAVILSGFFSVLAAAILLFIWPVLFGLLVRLGHGIASLGAPGAGIYAFLNRLLIPLGLHHALNNVFWFDTIGLGDLTNYWAGKTSADVSWSLGMYMSGFFPCMMFGIPGAALAMVHSAPTANKKRAAGILASAALCSFVCGVTEPFEFAFMFSAPVLYFIYALLYGLFAWVTALTPFRAGFSFSAGATDLIFSSTLPAAGGTWLILPLGAAAFVLFYLIFRILIARFHLKVPGQEEPTPENAASGAGTAAAGAISGSASGMAPTSAEAVGGSASDITPTSARAAAPDATSSGKPAAPRRIMDGIDLDAVITGLGGRDNIAVLDNCATRLRIEVRDDALVNEAILKSCGARAVLRPGKGSVQIVVGMQVQRVADALNADTDKAR